MRYITATYNDVESSLSVDSTDLGRASDHLVTAIRFIGLPTDGRLAKLLFDTKIEDTWSGSSVTPIFYITNAEFILPNPVLRGQKGGKLGIQLHIISQNGDLVKASNIVSMEVSESIDDTRWDFIPEYVGELNRYDERMDIVEQMVNAFDAEKEDKIDGMGLSSNDYTNADKSKVGALPTNVQKMIRPGSNVSIVQGVDYDVINVQIPAESQSDWNESNQNLPTYIRNKPTIPTTPGQVGAPSVSDLQNETAQRVAGDNASKDYTDAGLSLKADKTSVYTKIESDAKLDEKANAIEVEARLSEKALASDLNVERSERTAEDTRLMEEINKIESKKDITDLVDTYADLLAYPTIELVEGDIIKVLEDETRDTAMTYYRWISGSWAYVGKEGPYYTESEIDVRFSEYYKKPQVYTKTETDGLLGTKADVSALAGKVDKITGFGLSKNDYTDAEKSKLGLLPADAYSKSEANDLLDRKLDKDQSAIKNLFLYSDDDGNIIGKPAAPAPSTWGFIAGDLETQTDLYSRLNPQGIGATAEKAKILNSTQEVDFYIQGTNFVDVTYTFTASNQTIIQPLPSSESGITIMVKTDMGTFSGCKLVIGDTEIVDDGFIGVFYPNTTSYRFLRNPLSIDVSNVYDTSGGSRISQSDLNSEFESDLNTHVNDTSNPHSVTASQVGAYTKAETDTKLGEKVDNIVLADALALKADNTTVNAHIASVDNPHSVTKTQVGLSNVSNTSDADKPVSTLQQVALDKKVDKVSGKVLSSNDYTSAEKSKLASIPAILGTAAVKDVGTNRGEVPILPTDTDVMPGQSIRLNSDRSAWEPFFAQSSDPPVLSVQGKIGDVILAPSDIGADTSAQVTAKVDAEKALRQTADTGLQSQIDSLSQIKDGVADIVGSYAGLQAYDTSKLQMGSIVMVSADENHSNAQAYYRWNGATWTYISSLGPYYTKSEADLITNAIAQSVTDEETARISGDNGVQSNLNTHVNDKTNPHAVTKTQVGLSNVINSLQATKTEFDSHANSKTNPHAVTASQVGAYTKTETDNAVADEATLRANADNLRYTKTESDGKYAMQTDLNTEVTDRQSADTNLQNQVNLRELKFTKISQSATSFTPVEGNYYVFSGSISALTINSMTASMTEVVIEFTASSTFTISVGSGYTWVGAVPKMASGKKVILSIINNIIAGGVQQ